MSKSPTLIRSGESRVHWAGKDGSPTTLVLSTAVVVRDVGQRITKAGRPVKNYKPRLVDETIWSACCVRCQASKAGPDKRAVREWAQAHQCEVPNG